MTHQEYSASKLRKARDGTRHKQYNSEVPQMGNTNTNLSGGLVTQQFVKTYTTFSGVDITALFDDMTLMTLQGIAVSITREKVPA
jgi:hypothetical protein